MKARRFFRFLQEGHRVHANFALEQISIACAPQSGKEKLNSMIRQYQLASEDPIEAWMPNYDHSGIDRLKERGF